MFVIVLFLLASCGGGATSSDPSTCTGACGVVKLVVNGSQSFNPNIEHGRIVTYRVTISGDGIDSPITAEFDGTATEGVINGIPTGGGRQLVVEAVNPNSAIIRQGEKSDVKVEGGKTAEVEVTLESVPIFTNLADGNDLDNTRLAFQIFSDPANPVVVEDVTSDAPSALADVSTQAAEINPDTSTGFGKLAPVLQSTGQHKYTVRNVNTGRYSTVVVNLMDGTKRKGAPFFAAGDHASPGAKRRVSCGTH